MFTVASGNMETCTNVFFYYTLEVANLLHNGRLQPQVGTGSRVVCGNEMLYMLD